jgi:hypothetical protein
MTCNGACACPRPEQVLLLPTKELFIVKELVNSVSHNLCAFLTIQHTVDYMQKLDKTRIISYERIYLHS